MIYSCRYNPGKDIQAVSPTGALDLKEAFANNAIPADLQASEGNYNGIDDPSSIGTRVTDRLDAEILDRAFKSFKNEVKSE